MPKWLEFRRVRFRSECRWLFAAFFLGEQGGQRLQTASQDLALEPEIVPVRVTGKQSVKHARDLHTAGVERADFHSPVVRPDLLRRAGGNDVPARVPPGKLVSRR